MFLCVIAGTSGVIASQGKTVKLWEATWIEYLGKREMYIAQLPEKPCLSGPRKALAVYRSWGFLTT